MKLSVPRLAIAAFALFVCLSASKAYACSECIDDGQPNGCMYSLFYRCKQNFTTCTTLPDCQAPRAPRRGSVQQVKAAGCQSAPEMVAANARIGQLKVLSVQRLSARS